MRSLMWFRSDLRVADNPALASAAARATRGVVGVFLVAADQWAEHDWGDAKVDFVLRNLEALSDGLRKLRIPLLVRTCERFEEAPDELLAIARRHSCDELHFNHEYEVNEALRDQAVTSRFWREGLGVHVFHDQVVVAPGALRTGKGTFYTVFTPFKKAWLARLADAGVPSPAITPSRQPSLDLEADAVPERVKGFHRPDDALVDHWPAGEAAAQRRLARFIKKRIADYKNARDLPAVDGTSTLSPYLAIGAISAGDCLRAAADANRGRLAEGSKGADTWISELVWREFYRHVLVGFPRVSRHRPFKLDTDRIAWRDDAEGFAAWCEGRTGIPIVDAGMRQLRVIGWMHNRVRMITAMFLTKNLLVDWRAGERHFMRHLIDGDLASNNGGWQWSASTGTDAAPYFRIFNPESQSRKFDPEGTYIRRYVPELADVEGDAIHAPAAKGLFASAGEYPEPIVDLKSSRERAIAAFRD